MLSTSCLTINGQVLSDKDIKSYAEKLNQDNTGIVIDPKTGVKGRGVISIGRKIIFQYDVPDEWYPFDDIKQIVVKGILDNGKEKFALLQDNSSGNPEIINLWRKFIVEVLKIEPVVDEFSTFTSHHMIFKRIYLKSLKKQIQN